MAFHAWDKRPTSPREVDNQRLLARIREYHEASDGVMACRACMKSWVMTVKRPAATGWRD